MKILVCPLSQLSQMIAMHVPERVVSLLDPDFSFPELGQAYRDRHLRLHLHDIHDSTSDKIAPTTEHVRRLLEFLGAWQFSAPLLIHCRAGIGRSTAIGFIAACLHNPNIDELAIARQLRSASPFARPNQILIKLADDAMGRNGRMAKAIEETGRGLEWHHMNENTPFEMPIDSHLAPL